MNCPMKELLKETATTGASSITASTARKIGVNSVDSCVNNCVDSRMNPTTERTCVGVACSDCCALLAFKYIAACEDVVEFQRKVREVMRK